jgi:hypothetical protein
MTIYRADIPMPVYDRFREVVVLPLGLTQAEEADTVYLLMRERR